MNDLIKAKAKELKLKVKSETFGHVFNLENVDELIVAIYFLGIKDCMEQEDGNLCLTNINVCFSSIYPNN